MSSSRGKSSGRGASAHVRLVHRRALEVVRGRGVHLALLVEHVRVDRAALDVGRHDDELPDELRVVDRGLERDPAAERVADEVDLLEPEVLDEGGDVVAHRDEADRPVDVGRAPVALEVGEDDAVSGGELVGHRPEHLARPESAVEQHQRPAAAVDLVVEADAVDIGIGAGALGLGRPVGGRHRDAPRAGLRWGLARRYPRTVESRRVSPRRAAARGRRG